MKLTLFQQSAFVLAPRRGEAVAFDLGREVPAETVDGLRVGAAVVSHGHPDHFHLEHLMHLGVPIFGAADLEAHMSRGGLAFHALEPGRTRTVGGLRLTAFAVDHGPDISSPLDNLGLMAEADGRRVLFLGDMATPGPIPAPPWDLVLIPVGGSKVFSPEAAADFVEAVRVSGAVVPIHFHGRSDRTSGARFCELVGGRRRARLVGVGQTIEV